MMDTAPVGSGPVTAVRAMPLIHAELGDMVRVVRISAQGRDAQSMVAAGLAVGRVCAVVGRPPGGGVVVAVDGRHLAVGNSIASGIWVRLVDG